MRRLLIPVLMMLWGALQAQELGNAEKYWVFFHERDAAILQSPPALSEKALKRRQEHGVALQSSDFPIGHERQVIISGLAQRAGYPSKWLNALSAWLTPEQRAQVANLPFVKEIRPVKRYWKDMDAMDQSSARNGYFPGYASAQVRQVGLDRLHQNGLNGRGILIAVIDNGFSKANENPWLQHLFLDNRIVATYDFVNQESDVFDQGSHGQYVLSILAGWHEADDSPAAFYGSAHGASYLLCHTENDASETSQEEDNWVRAMEWADSIGADIFSTSLSYRDFDGGFDYGFSGMDGNTAIITVAADIAASKGIVVVNSAGNSGNNKIYAPADGDSVIAVGAVDSTGQIASFSSRGPTFDLRIKPDICAMGASTAYIQNSGVFSRGNGTSFSCPVISGMLACLLQAKPGTANMDLYRAMIQSADRYNSPDTIYGYGIPNAAAAYETLTGRSLASVPQEVSTPWEFSALAYPNPFSESLNLAIDNGMAGFPARIELVDTKGRKVWSKETQIHPFYNFIEIEPGQDGWPSVSGAYALRVLHAESKWVISSQVILYQSNR